MHHILITECEDQPGLISDITRICFEHKLNIIKNSEFVDPQSQTFFMRTVLQSDATFDEAIFLNELTNTLPSSAKLRIANKEAKKVILLATKESHCLSDILIKNYNRVLNIEVVAVISNHDILKPLVDKFNIPFHFITHENISREQHEKNVLACIQSYEIDLVVLAKYMRILSEEFVNQIPQAIINIHHSFLPAFIGASPYKQAFDRGVKMIGATAHFVNHELDQGPIIQQDVIHVDHSFQPNKLAKAGQQLEESVLLKALQLVIREKVFIHGNRTIVFP